MNGKLLATTGAVQRLAPSRAQSRKAERRTLLVAMVALAVLPPLVALSWHLGLRAAQAVAAVWEGGAR
jgi:uncharacterized iron-regulated membrane protein